MSEENTKNTSCDWTPLALAGVFLIALLYHCERPLFSINGLLAVLIACLVVRLSLKYLPRLKQCLPRSLYLMAISAFIYALIVIVGKSGEISNFQNAADWLFCLNGAPPGLPHLIGFLVVLGLWIGELGDRRNGNIGDKHPVRGTSFIQHKIGSGGSGTVSDASNDTDESS